MNDDDKTVDVGTPVGEVSEAEGFDEAVREQAEEEALAQVFADVRTQSARGQLVEPTRWETMGIIPEHLSAEEFEMLTYDVLEQARAEAAAIEEPKKPEFRTATRSVGVPRPIGVAADADPEDDAAESDQDPGLEAEAAESDPGSAAAGVPAGELDREPVEHEAADVSEEFDLGFTIPEGYELVELEGELVVIPLEDSETEEAGLACDDIVTLVGKHSYYLYSREFMTDTYAHWAFLASEDDRVLTFIDCVREESRVYPRPMLASSLMNEPFCMTPEEIDETWKAVSESGEYPDIGQVFASNGEAFFFSEDHLSRAYAQSLAEWHAVEREMNL